MTITFRRYTSQDYMKIRNFLVSTYTKFGKSYNWTLERWNFSVMARIMNGVTLEQWEREIGIWESDGNIIAVVNSEGEGKGEAFFQLARLDMHNNILEEMFNFAEKNIAIKKDGQKFIQLRIPEGDQKREMIAKNRGYLKQDYFETISEIKIDQRPYSRLPEGFSIIDGSKLDEKAKGIAHAKAFGYYHEEKYVKRIFEAYKELIKTPDYKPELDLYVINQKGEVVAFCTIWYDEINQIGILEPVGTIPEYRKRGLARAVIGEALSRIASRDAQKAFVGSGQDFYTAIGFVRKYKNNIWKKRF